MATNYICYIINLDYCNYRYEFAEKCMKHENMAFERLSAVDGRNLTAEAFVEYNKNLSLVENGRSLSSGEVACYLSHRMALETFLSTDYDYCIVFEDDMKLLENFSSIIKNLLKYFENNEVDWDVVNIGRSCKRYCTKLENIKDCNGSLFTLYAAHYFPLLATGMLWSRNGAHAFLSSSLPITVPVDIFIRNLCFERNKGFALNPSPVQTSGAPSVIDAHKNRRKEHRLRGPLLHFIFKQYSEIRNRIKAYKNQRIFRLSRAK